MYYINIRGGKKQWIKMLKLNVFSGSWVIGKQPPKGIGGSDMIFLPEDQNAVL